MSEESNVTSLKPKEPTRAELEAVKQERDEARTEAEAAIIADLRDSANRWADFRHPRPSVDARNRSIAAALRKAANRYECGEHRKEIGE